MPEGGGPLQSLPLKDFSKPLDTKIRKGCQVRKRESKSGGEKDEEGKKRVTWPVSPHNF